MTKNYDVQVLIDELKIKNRIKDLSSEINQFYTNTNKLLVVGLLRGSFVFIADLAREIKVPVEIDFMTVSSYGNSMVSSHNVRILSDLNTDINPAVGGIRGLTTLNNGDYDSMLLKKTQKKPTNINRYPIKRYFHRCRRAFTIQYKTFCVQYPLCVYVRSYIMLYVKLNISLKFIALSLWKLCKYEREL